MGTYADIFENYDSSDNFASSTSTSSLPCTTAAATALSFTPVAGEETNCYCLATADTLDVPNKFVVAPTLDSEMSSSRTCTLTITMTDYTTITRDV